MCVFFSVSTKDNCSNNIQTKQNKKEKKRKSSINMHCFTVNWNRSFVEYLVYYAIVDLLVIVNIEYNS